MRLRIPGLVDLATVSERAAIREAAANPSLDRQFVPSGPLINRLLMSRVCRALTVDGKRLPSIASRDDRERAKNQISLQQRLDDAARGNIVDNETLMAIVEAIRSNADASTLAIAAQQAVGRWFVSDYIANARTWKAARELQAAASSRNLVYSLYLFLSGKVRRAQRSLGRRVDSDRAGIHATGIAVHNIVRGLKEMQKVWHDRNLRRRLSVDAVLGRCLFAPENVLRQATSNGASSVGAVSPGTLVLLSLETARSRDPGNDMSFMSEFWSHCPAGAAVVALFRAVWIKLNADDGGHE